MTTSNIIEEESIPEGEDTVNDTEKSFVQQKVVEHHPGDSFKKMWNNLKSKSATAGMKRNGAKIGNTPQGPVRSSGQGLHPFSGKKGRTSDPDMRLRAFVAPAMSAPPSQPAKKIRLLPNGERTRKAYWDVAAALSLVVNAILVAVLLVMGGQIKNLKVTMNNLLGGLYGNFVEMDQASISTTIAVETQIPIVFSLPIEQNTTVTLTSDVPLIGAQVVINSGGLSINAPANVTLPSGSNLPIALKMDVPVQLSIPVSLQVPVNIPLNQTTLHAPFTGLQQTVLPLYCTLNKNAQYPSGVYICAGHDESIIGSK
jgi:hypothetical protein